MKQNTMPICILQDELNDSLCHACQFGDFEKVKYLLTSKELDKHADISCYNNAPLRNACSSEYISIINYLLCSPELVQHPDIHQNNDSLFNHLLEYKIYNIINYLIFEIGLEKTKDIENLLICYPKKDMEEIEKLFEIRDLRKDLSNDLDYSLLHKQNKKTKL
jgi:hypothetical protein